MASRDQPSAEAQQIQILNIVWAAQLLGPFLFAGLAFVLAGERDFGATDGGGLGLMVSLAQVFAIAAPFAGWFFGNRTAAPRPGDTRSAIEILRTGQIVAGAIGQAGAMFAVVVFLLTGEKVLLAALLPMLFLFLSIRPTRERLATVRRRLEQVRSSGAR